MSGRVFGLVSACVLGCLLAGCGANPVSGQGAADARLAARVVAAIENASDLPASTLAVDVDGGVVILSGSIVCGDCGGSLTPGGTATIQQSLGAVVRAVPGVDEIEFDLEYQRPSATGN